MIPRLFQALQNKRQNGAPELYVTARGTRDSPFVFVLRTFLGIFVLLYVARDICTAYVVPAINFSIIANFSNFSHRHRVGTLPRPKSPRNSLRLFVVPVESWNSREAKASFC